MLAQDTGEMDLARRRYEESLAMMRELGNRAGIATALGALAILEKAEGNEAEAERLYREAIDIGGQIGDVAGMSIDLFNLALLLEKQARLAEALPLLQQSLANFQRLGSPYANSHVPPRPGARAAKTGNLKNPVFTKSRVFAQSAPPR